MHNKREYPGIRIFVKKIICQLLENIWGGVNYVFNLLLFLESMIEYQDCY